MRSSPLIYLSLFSLALPLTAAPVGDNVRTEVRTEPKSAEFEKPAPNLPASTENSAIPNKISKAELQVNPTLTKQLLVRAIYARNADLIEQLLSVYQTFPQQDETLVQFAQAKIAALREDYAEAIDRYRHILAKRPNLNPIRIELAIVLFQQKQDNAAKTEFQHARTANDLPPLAMKLIDDYLTALAERNEWTFDFSAYYLRDKNVNNVSSSREIEQTGFVKSDQMLPQSAHGIAYNVGIGKDFNLGGSHYLSFQNDFNDKIYWDNHDYDDLFNRISLGYAHKSAVQTFRLLPFYEKEWYSGESYHWQNGVRAEYSRWLSPNWQLSTALEWGKTRYFDSTAQNGNNKLVSVSLFWLRSPKQFFYLGTDFNAQRTQVRQYANDLKSIRLGWGQYWQWGIATRVNLSFAKRHYKDTARLGGILNLGKVREDNIYSVNLQLWKRDWHILGITPKLVYRWRKQSSNIPTMYSYTDKNLNLIFERSF